MPLKRPLLAGSDPANLVDTRRSKGHLLQLLNCIVRRERYYSGLAMVVRAAHFLRADEDGLTIL